MSSATRGAGLFCCCAAAGQQGSLSLYLSVFPFLYLSICLSLPHAHSQIRFSWHITTDWLCRGCLAVAIWVPVFFQAIRVPLKQHWGERAVTVTKIALVFVSLPLTLTLLLAMSVSLSLLSFRLSLSFFLPRSRLIHWLSRSFHGDDQTLSDDLRNSL